MRNTEIDNGKGGMLNRFCKLMTSKEQDTILKALMAFICTEERTTFTDRFMQLAFDTEVEYTLEKRRKKTERRGVYGQAEISAGYESIL